MIWWHNTRGQLSAAPSVSNKESIKSTPTGWVPVTLCWLSWCLTKMTTEMMYFSSRTYKVMMVRSSTNLRAGRNYPLTKVRLLLSIKNHPFMIPQRARYQSSRFVPISCIREAEIEHSLCVYNQFILKNYMNECA